MNKKMVLIIALVSALILSTPIVGCTPTPTPQNQQPIEVISVLGPLPPINPGGPMVGDNSEECLQRTCCFFDCQSWNKPGGSVQYALCLQF